MSIVTCRNPDCVVVDRPVPMDLTFPDLDTGELRPVDVVACGACSQPITDINDAP